MGRRTTPILRVVRYRHLERANVISGRKPRESASVGPRNSSRLRSATVGALPARNARDRLWLAVDLSCADDHAADCGPGTHPTHDAVSVAPSGVSPRGEIPTNQPRSAEQNAHESQTSSRLHDRGSRLGRGAGDNARGRWHLGAALRPLDPHNQPGRVSSGSRRHRRSTATGSS